MRNPSKVRGEAAPDMLAGLAQTSRDRDKIAFAMNWPSNDQLTVLIFDLTIAIVTVTIPVWLYFFWRRRRWPTWPKWARVMLTAVLAVGWLLVVYGSFVEPRELRVTEYRLDVRPDKSAVARTLRLAIVSDTHLGLYKGRAWADRVVAKLNGLSPDAVLMAGDFVSSESGYPDLAAFGNLRAPLGAYAVLGNWDYHVGAVDVRRTLGSYGVRTLVNRSVELNGLPVVGIDGLIYGNPDWDKALAGVDASRPWLALVHNPDGALWASRLGASVVVAGHTHGGQLRLPFIGSLPQLPIRLGQGYDFGVFDFYGSQLLITSGAGESGARSRLLRPPEVVLLELTY
jgi:hypothetical protein